MIRLEEAAVRRFHELSDKVLRSGFLSEGELTKQFEAQWQEFAGLPAVAVSSGGFALWALLEAAGVRGHEVIVPTNTFMATPLAVEKAGGKVVFADCNRQDLCLSLKDIEAVMTPATKAVVLVHIGGHLAFESEAIARFCKDKGLALIEDCAHAHGATLHGKAGGSFGLGGAYSFYATKTLTIGEGGMVVSNSNEVIEFVRSFRNYGKFAYKVAGFHGRMSEITAALGVAQLEQLPKILDWKRRLAAKYDEIFANRVSLPEGMVSGYYKYIVFEETLKEKTGAVYSDLCHSLRGVAGNFPESEWIAKHHSCPPIWYGYDGIDLNPEALRQRLLS